MHDGLFTIGALSGHTGVNIETIRYYERVGVMSPARRSEGGHRLYDRESVARLRFVRRARELGFSLDDIRFLLGLDDGEPSCATVLSMTQKHLAQVRAKIADLEQLEATLSRVVEQCDGGQTPDCPIIEALSAPKTESDTLSDPDRTSPGT